VRRIRSVPIRNASDTWAVIIDLLAPTDDAMRSELETAGNVAAMLISEEHSAEAPILFSGCGPQVRMYTIHGDAAVEAESANETALTLTPSESWELGLPATGPDLALAAAAVRDLDHVTIYDPAAGGASQEQSSHARCGDRVHVDLDALEE
jgi:hypothetical protein